MSQKKIVEFEIENNKIYIEAALPAGVRSGGFVASNAGETVVKATGSMQKALEPVMGFAKEFITRIGNLSVEKPTGVELEFGIKLSGEVDFWVISGQGEGTINLKLTWETK